MKISPEEGKMKITISNKEINITLNLSTDNKSKK